jgi:O-antigen/teichoic acid export membrane protein
LSIDEPEGTTATDSPRRRRWTRWFAPSGASALGKNTLYSIAGFAVPALGLLLFTPILIHELGASEYGLWALCTSLLGLAGVFDLGLSTAVAKHVAQYRAAHDIDGLSSSVTAGTALYVVVGLVVAPIAFVLAPVIAPVFAANGVSDETVTTLFRIVSLGIVPLLLKNAALAVPIGLQRFGPPTAIAILQTSLTLGLATAVAYSDGSIELVVASTVASLSLTSVVSLVVGYRMLASIGARTSFSRTELRTLLRFSAFTGVTAVGHVLFASLDRVVVGAVLGPSAVAYYSVSIGLAINLLFVADALTRPLMPAASAWTSVRDWGRVRAWLKRATLGVAVLELVAAGILLLVSEPFLTLWLGSDFTEHAVTPFRILVVVFAVVAVGAPAFHIANGAGYPWAPALGGSVGGALTIVFIFLLAPTWGVSGAAAANFWGWTALFPLAYLTWKFRPRASLSDRAPSP